MAHEITGRYAIVDGARAYYDVCGSGIPFVCVHMGWGLLAAMALLHANI
jgi:hypothetical protein